MSNISIKSKLLAMLLGVSLASIAVVSTLNFVTSYQVMRESVFEHLTSVRASRGAQMRQGFDQMRRETRALSNGRLLGEAAVAFSQAFTALNSASLTPEQLDTLRSHYTDAFLARLEKNTRGTPEVANYLPEPVAAQFLQYHFIAANQNPVGNKDAYLGGDLAFDYARAHAEYHPLLRNIARNFDSYDLLIIDIDSGAIVYSTEKETDFGTSLTTGPYANSNLAQLFRRVQRAPDRGAVEFIDFAFYRPSFDEPAAFFAAPIMQNSKVVAVLALQTSVDRLNAIMTGEEQWERDGLGKTGETILIGADYTMRSASRFLLEDPDGYVKSLRDISLAESEIRQIIARDSPILEQSVRTRAAEEALRGRSGTGVIIDYRGVEILGSWAPLEVEGLNWAIVGKMDLAEAYAPISELAKNTVIYTIVLLVVITLVVMFLASSFVRPVNDLIRQIQRVGAGEQDVSLGSDSSDEIGELSRSFRELADNLHSQTRELSSITARNQKLLEIVMPRGLAQRVSNEASDISEDVDEVTVLFAELNGLVGLIEDDTTNAMGVLRSLVTAFDAAAVRLDVEKIRTDGDTYMAACGLSTPVFDHARRAVDFAIDLHRIVRQFNAENDTAIGLAVGLSSGSVQAHVSQQQALVFQLWGATVIEADYARDRCQAGNIAVTEQVYTKLKELYDFEPQQDGNGVRLWNVGGAGEAVARA